jgi:fructokinase
MKLFGGIEAGGTKFVCAVGDEKGKIYDEITLPTKTPEETIQQIIDFFTQFSDYKKIAGYGIGCFGPIDTNKKSKTYGYITATPKKEWIDFNIVGALQSPLKKPMNFVTDVAAAAFGEYTWGEGQDLDHVIYMTVGTGIGAASIIQGKLLAGTGHQEVGHMLIPHDKNLDQFEGVCPYHGDCFEGLASGTSMKKRWNVESALHLPANHQAWKLEADYIASGLMNCVLTLSPNRIILGGGVMRQMHLFPKIRERLEQKVNGYVHLDDLETFIVSPGLSDRSGVMGAIALGQVAAES